MTTFARQAFACGVVLFCLVPLHGLRAAAQEQEKQEEKEKPTAVYTDEITVTEEKDPSLTIPSPQTAAQEIRAVAGGAAFVDAEDYKRGRISTLKDALGFTPGVLVQPRFGSDEARLSIRGSGLQRTFHGRGIKLLQDGVP